MSQSNEKARFEKKVMAELTGKAETKAETIEGAAQAILYQSFRNDDSLRGQIHALSKVIDQLADLSLPRAIAFLGQAIHEIDNPKGLSPRDTHDFRSQNSYTRGRLSDWQGSYERKLSEVLAKGPVPPEKPVERVHAYFIPHS